MRGSKGLLIGQVLTGGGGCRGGGGGGLWDCVRAWFSLSRASVLGPQDLPARAQRLQGLSSWENRHFVNGEIKGGTFALNSRHRAHL